MKRSEVIETSRKFAEPFCVTNGTKFRLKDFDPADTGKATSEDKSKAKEMLEAGIQALAELRDILYAQDRWSVLLIFQAMDAARKALIAVTGHRPPTITKCRLPSTIGRPQ